MSKKLQEIRTKIDAIDKKIHALLVERASFVPDIVAEKKKQKRAFMDPAREANLIRELLERHEGDLPQETVVRIWRELVSALLTLQTNIEVVVACDDQQSDTWDMARDFFGSVVPMKKSASAIAALANVREDEAAYAVLDWPHEEPQPWWIHLLNRENQQMHIVGALPFGTVDCHLSALNDKALVVSKAAYKSSGQDHSFLAFDVEQSMSRGSLVDLLKSHDLEVLSVQTHKFSAGVEHTIYLLEVDDFVAQDDKRLKSIEATLEVQQVTCLVLGGYPVPPVFPKRQAGSAGAVPFAPTLKETKKTKKAG